MTSLCVNPDPETGNLPPSFCDPSFVDTDDYAALCDPYKNAIKALRAKMGDAATSSAAITFKMPIASCRVVPASLVEEASNNGLDITKLQDNWVSQAISTTSDGQCTSSGYGVFDASGNKVMTTNDAGAAVPATVTSLYEDRFASCTSSSDREVAPYFLNTTTGACPTATFSAQCQDPLKTTYAPCRNPGWDYMDTSGTWSYDMASCTGESFSGQDYVDQSGNAAGVDCTNQCCIYANLTSTETSTLNCTSCTQATGSASPYYQDWANGPKMTLANADGASISVPYCNQTSGSQMQNSQGFALSLMNAETDPSVATFGDPAACRSDGAFAESCNGLTGCDGLTNGLNTDGANTKPCRMGFSSQPPHEPAGNCPNIYTIVDSAQDCRFSTTGSGSSQLVCQPGTSIFDTGTCSAFDAGDLAARPVLTDDGYPRVKQLRIPEGAWVTTYNNNAGGGFQSEAPDNVNVQLCNPSEFPSSGADAWTFGCGRDQTGNLVGRSQAIKVKPNGSWEAGTSYTGNAGSCSSDDPSCVSTDTAFDTSRTQGDVTVNPSGKTCTFTLVNNTPMYGWSLGFMPGYYNSSCQTSGTGNECGTMAP